MQNPSHTCPQCHSSIPADAPGGLCPACVLLGVAGLTNLSQAAAAKMPTLDEVAAAFPELEVLDVLGQGGMGIVFKTRQPRLDRLVALREAGKGAHFDALKPWLTGESAALSQTDAAQQLGMGEGAVKVAIHRLRQRFRDAR